MSPEQAAADANVDHRADIYAVGVLAYELLTGRPPFTGTTQQEIIAAHVTKAAEPITKFRETVPPDLERLVMRCLAKRPADRWQTAEELRVQLEASATPGGGASPTDVKRTSAVVVNSVVGAVLLVLAVALVVWLQVSSGTTTFTERPRLAVLPLGNLGSPDDEYFADGLTEEITNRLVQLSGLTVISRTSAILYKNHDKTLPQIGEELGVDYVLEGTVRTDRSSGGVGHARVTQQLIRVQDDAHLWSDGYTVELLPGEIFAVQADIAENVAQALGVTLLEPERRALDSRPTENAEAFDYYLQGRDYHIRGYFEDDLRIAVQMYQRAVELDPAFAISYASLSQAHALLYWQYYDRSEQRLADAKAAADRALALEPDLPEAHLALGYYYYWGLLDYERALEQFAIVERSRPNDSDLAFAIGAVARRQGEWEVALAKLMKAADLAPRSTAFALEVGATLGLLRNTAEAERWFDRVISLAPDRVDGYAVKVMVVLGSRNNIERIRETLRYALEKVDAAELTMRLAWWFEQRAFIRLDEEYQLLVDGLTASSFAPDSAAYFLSRAVSFGQRNQSVAERAYYDSARTVLESQVQARPEDVRVRGRLGLAYAGLGFREKAVVEGERAVELLPVSKDAVFGPLCVQNLAEILVMLGEYDAALDQLEYLLSVPSLVTVPLLRADPLYDPLRNLPRFQALLTRYEN
jgi:serine/threonine-protein kinase